MKNHSLKFAFVWLVAGLFLIFSQNGRAQDLSGADAVEQLKQDGSYDSLVEAVKSVQPTGGRFDESFAPSETDAVGQTAKLLASDGGSSKLFGNSIAISGDTAIIGAIYDNVGANGAQGSAYIFVRSGTTWIQQAKLTAADGASVDLFGGSVAIVGNTAVVGAFVDDVGANTDQGSAYVFTRSGTTWTQLTKLTAADGAANDRFGSSVAIDGRTIIVGAFLDDIGANIDQGSAYIFVQNGAAWIQQAKLTASDGTTGDSFGNGMALDSDTAIIGAPSAAVGTNGEQGAAYVFTRSGTTWTQQAILAADDGAASDRFGGQISLDGDTAVIGENYDDVGANPSQGAAYVFVRKSTKWTQQAKLTAADGAAEDRFGSSVVISGDTAIVGAFLDDVGANTDQGSAYVFTRSGTTWTQQTKLTASDGAAGDKFNIAALEGNTIIVGALWDDVGANTNQGSAYVFRNLSGNWTQEAVKVADSVPDVLFGYSVALEGSTAIVGAPEDKIGANYSQGSAFIFVRNGASWELQAKLTAGDGSVNDVFGSSVAIDGDTVIIGAWGNDAGTVVNRGAAYVFVRSGKIWTQQAKLSTGAAEDLFGWSVAIEGNTAVVGAIRDDVGANTDQGSIHVYIRSGTSWSYQANLTGTGGASEDFFGKQIGISGETIIVGAYLDDVGANSNQGSAYIFERSGSNWTQQAQLTASDGTAQDVFGSSVAISGDTAIVGAYLDDVGANVDQGSAYIYARSGSNWTQQQQIVKSGSAANDYFSYSVSISGDKILVGAPLSGTDDRGAAVFFINQPLANLAAFLPIENEQITSAAEIPRR